MCNEVEEVSGFVVVLLFSCIKCVSFSAELEVGGYSTWPSDDPVVDSVEAGGMCSLPL